MIRAAIVGLGWWGRTLLEAAAGSAHIRFTVAVSRHPTGAIESLANDHGLRLVHTFDAALAAADVDAVVLATPPTTHVEQVVAAAQAGKHVYCEKPFTLNKEDAARAVAAMRDAGTTLALGYNRRFHPEMARLRRMIQSGELGSICHLEATMSVPNGLLLNPDAWRADREEAPCGGLAPLGVHAIDGMIDLCGPIKEVYCQSFRRAVAVPTDDTTSILFRMKAGMSAYLGTMMATGPGFSFSVFGSKGWVRFEGTTHVAGASSEERRTTLFGTCRFQPVQGEVRAWQAAKLDIIRETLEAFAVAAGGGAPFLIPVDEMVHGAAVTEAVVKSAASGRVEKIS